MKKMLVTSALPYANGPIHLGHMVEYIQTDIFVRFLRLNGKNVIYVCADDTHGTPIELKARELNIPPEELIKKIGAEHRKDFNEFGISFDNYYSTNSPENKKWSEYIFNKLKSKNLIYQKEIGQYYSPSLKRFLPDRYIKGKCPKCRADDQYGDVCEKCGATYKPTDLIKPYCAIDKSNIELRKSTHYFFKLSTMENELKKFIEKGDFQEEMKHFILNWINNGLEDWCISRDGPYFGFKIPGEKDKYFYVWLDAPVGYIASTADYCKRNKCTENDYWQSKDAEIIHFIGKDISYFHFLFWPAMLMNSGLKTPNKIHVHGFLTVNKEKMSKSRGTFITAREYLNNLNPSFLRFYFASHLSENVEDIDLNLAHFKEIINNELIANFANFAYRVASFTEKNFGGKTVKYRKPAFTKEIEQKFKQIEKNYEICNLKEVVKDALYISSLGNKYFQENEPWKLINEDKKKTHEIVSFCIELLKNLSIIFSPIIPNTAHEINEQLKYSDLSWKDLKFECAPHKIGKAKPLLKKIEDEINHLIQKKVEKNAQNKTQDTTGKSKIDIDDILYMRTGEIVDVKQHPNADKLYIEQIDFGDEKRQVISGLREWYELNELKGKRVIVLCNLKPANIRGEKSEGMVLVAEKGDKVMVLEGKKKGEQAYFSERKKSRKEVTFDEFKKLEIYVENGKVVYNGLTLKTDSKEIKSDLEGGKVC